MATRAAGIATAVPIAQAATVASGAPIVSIARTATIARDAPIVNIAGNALIAANTLNAPESAGAISMQFRPGALEPLA